MKKQDFDYSDEAMLKVFPEAKLIFPGKIAELREERQVLWDKALLIAKKNQKLSANDRTFGEAYIEAILAPKIVKLEQHIARLYRLSRIASGHKPAKAELDINRAKQVPIESFLSGEPRKSGNKLQYCCPLHGEKNPSLFIYEDNHFHCFGCQEHGDVIDFVQKLKNLDFREAVNYLL